MGDVMNSFIRTCWYMALWVGFCGASSQLYGQVVYSISGFANNSGILDSSSRAPEISVGESYIAEFLIDTSVLDSDPSSDRGEYPNAILSATIEFEGGYISQVDYAGGDVVIQRDLDGGGIFLLDANGGNIILVYDLHNPFDSDALLIDPATQFDSAPASFFLVQEPSGFFSSTSDVEFDAQNGTGPIVFAVISSLDVPVLRGDCDLDGAVTFDDIEPMIEYLINGTFLAQADCNDDGDVNFADIPRFVEILIGG